MDLARAWHRVFVRAGIPLAFSEGFSPHPKVAFGPALPVSVCGFAEYLDMAHTGEAVDVDALIAGVNEVAPPGMLLTGGMVLPRDRRVPSLGGAVQAADYALAIDGMDPEEMSAVLTRHGIMAKKGDSESAGPLLSNMEEYGSGAKALLRVPINFKPLAIFGAPGADVDPRKVPAVIDRLALWVIVDGRLVEPFDI